MAATIATTRVVAVVRVSEQGDRHGDQFRSPVIQATKMIEDTSREGGVLVGTLEEIDVSGRLPLNRRHGLRAAVEMIEAGEANVLLVAYFDRLCRSLKVQEEVITRVEAAGGKVRAIDIGDISYGTTAQWLSATSIGMLNEYFGRMVAEKVHPAHQAAIDAGIPPWPRVTPGYVRGADRRFIPDERVAPLVARAFELRADGMAITDVARFLAEEGIEGMTFAAAQRLLASKVVLGEIHFGKYRPNLDAHPAIVERDLFDRVQRTRIPRGRHAKAPHLLARLGVLRCASCGGRMVVESGKAKGKSFYRCPTKIGCSRRVTIHAALVEPFVVDAVEAHLADMRGRASVEQRAHAAIARRDAAEAALKRARRIALASDGDDDDDVIAQLEGLKAVRNARQAEVDRLGAVGRSRVVTVRDFRTGLLVEQRGLIRDVVESIMISPGRGTGRVTLKFFGE